MKICLEFGWNKALLITCTAPFQRWSMLAEHRGRRKVECRHTDICLMKTCSRTLRTSGCAEGPPSKSIKNHREDLDRITHLWRNVKMTFYQQSLSNLDRAWENLEKNSRKPSSANVQSLMHHTLEAAIIVKGASNKYWNEYLCNVIMSVFPLKKVQSCHECVFIRRSVHWCGGKNNLNLFNLRLQHEV